jgi:hypothetical protein
VLLFSSLLQPGGPKRTDFLPFGLALRATIIVIGRIIVTGRIARADTEFPGDFRL